MKYPKITVITPNYNGGAFLENTIKSVVSQNYPNLEYIIIDGGSTDNSIEIIEKYSDSLAYWVSEPDNGLYDALQKGFERSTGEILSWINSDDMQYPFSLQTVAEIFSSYPCIEWVEGLNVHIDEKGRIFSAEEPRQFTYLDFLLGDYKFIQQESTFWRRTLWDKAGGYISDKLRLAGDMELWMRFFRHAKLYTTSFYIGSFRHRSNNQLSLNYINEYFNECEKVICAERQYLQENKQINGRRSLRLTILFFSFLEAIHLIKLSRKMRNRYLKKGRKNTCITLDRKTQLLSLE